MFFFVYKNCCSLSSYIDDTIFLWPKCQKSDCFRSPLTYLSVIERQLYLKPIQRVGHTALLPPAAREAVEILQQSPGFAEFQD